MRQSELKLEIGNRYLIEKEQTRYLNKKEMKTIVPEEVEVLEFSPSGIYVKIKYPANTAMDCKFDWDRADKIKIMEQLENQNTVPF